MRKQGRSLYRFSKFNALVLFLLFVYVADVAAVQKKLISLKQRLNPLLLEIEINQHRLSGVSECYQDEHSQIWIRDQDIKTWGIRLPHHRPRIYRHRRLYSLKWYSGLQYRLDPYAMLLKVQAPARLFPVVQFSPAVDLVPALRPQDQGGFLNYDLTAFRRSDFNQTNFSGFFDVNFFNRYGVGHNNVLIYRNYTNDFLHTNKKGYHLIRLDTQWVLDQPETMSSWRLGDSITGGLDWSGAARFAGIQYATNFATQPNFITFPLPGFRGESAVPSTLNVFINSMLNQRQFAQEGPYIFDRIPVITGAGTVSIVTQDILGRSQIVNFPYYASNQLLRPGLSNFSYEAGFIRRNYGIHNNDYGRFLVSATYQYGMTNTLTLGTHTELLRKQQTLGVSADYLWKQYGVISVAAAGGHNTALGKGTLLSLGFLRQTPILNYGFKTTWSSPHYLQLGDQPYARPRSTGQIFADYTHAYGTLGVSYTLVNNRVIHKDGLKTLPTTRLLTINYSKALFSHALLNCGIVNDLHHARNSQAFLSVYIPLDSGYGLSNFTSRQQNHVDSWLQFSKNRFTPLGYSYDVIVSTLRDRIAGADIAVQSEHGAYAARIAHGRHANSDYEFDASGSAIYFAGDTFLTRKVNNSFAVAQVPSFSDIGVVYQNQPVGSTNKQGNLLIPDLLPYQQNNIALDLTTLPLNTHFNYEHKKVEPYFHSGVLVRFPVQRMQGILLHLATEADHWLPAGSRVVFKSNRSTVDNFVGYGGTVYLTNVQTASIRGKAYWDKQSCNFSVRLPKTMESIVDIGKVVCQT